MILWHREAATQERHVFAITTCATVVQRVLAASAGVLERQ